jgi:hypothetical protein
VVEVVMLLVVATTVSVLEVELRDKGIIEELLARIGEVEVEVENAEPVGLEIEHLAELEEMVFNYVLLELMLTTEVEVVVEPIVVKLREVQLEIEEVRVEIVELMGVMLEVSEVEVEVEVGVVLEV